MLGILPLVHDYALGVGCRFQRLEYQKEIGGGVASSRFSHDYESSALSELELGQYVGLWT